MKSLKKLPTLIFFAGFLLAACATLPNLTIPSASNPSPQTTPELVAIPGVPDQAIPLFSQNCSSCHGATGAGTNIAPALNSPDLRARLNEEAIYATIYNGRRGTAMPAWGGRLSDDDIAALVALIVNWDQVDAEQLGQMEEQAGDCGGWSMHPGMGMRGRGCSGSPWWLP